MTIESNLYNKLEKFLNNEDLETSTENANKDATSVSTHRDLIAGIVSKDMTLNHILPQYKGGNELVKLHEEGYIHIHDLDYFISPLTNCLLVDYKTMLQNGFFMGNVFMETPKSIGVASTVLTQICQGVASRCYGGQTFSHIDSGLAPYVKKSRKKIENKLREYNLHDKLTSTEFSDIVEETLEKEVYDAMQALLYQVNTLSSTNGQTPFVTISMGLDTSIEGRMITKMYLLNHMKGLGKEKRTPIFPKVVFFTKEDTNLNPYDDNYDLFKLANECSAKRIYPDYINVDLVNKMTSTPESESPITPMGCRSFLKYDPSHNTEGRFNLGVVSLNLPLITKTIISEGLNNDILTHMPTEDAVESIIEEITYYLKPALHAHLIRIERLSNMKAKQNDLMFCQGAIAKLDPEDTISKILDKASVSFGYIGLWESTSLIMDEIYNKYNEYEKSNLDSQKDLGLRILSAINEKIEQYSQIYGYNFSLYGTPSESYCHRSSNLFHEKFPESFPDKKYFTNSFHLPVWIQANFKEKIDFESNFAMVSNGGAITYVEEQNLSNNLSAYESIIKYLLSKVPYGSINTPNDMCFECDFEGEFKATEDGYTCPNCGNNDSRTINVIRRVSGYLSSPDARPFNAGKQAEVIDRVKHK